MISFAETEPTGTPPTSEAAGPPSHADEGRGTARAVLPLWLTEQEAELMTLLCAGSPADGGSGEGELFARLGELLRAFRR